MDQQTLKSWALEFGFCDAALCSAAPFDAQRQTVLSQPPLAERRQLRFEPQTDDARINSLAVLLWSYAPYELPEGRTLFVDSYYQASNAAYHAAKELEARLLAAGCYAKANVSYPAKEAAVRAGLGLIGDHSMLIHPVYGTRVVIILMATEIPAPQTDFKREECLHCARCAAACPVGAIDQDGLSHPEKCLRNFMMEGILVPESVRALMGNHLIGCDCCQRACPKNQTPTTGGPTWSLDAFATEDSEAFSRNLKQLSLEIGRNTARAQRVRAQTALLCGIVGDERDLPVLSSWADSEYEAVREHARWAIERIRTRAMQSDGSCQSGLDQKP